MCAQPRPSRAAQETHKADDVLGNDPPRWWPPKSIPARRVVGLGVIVIGVVVMVVLSSGSSVVPPPAPTPTAGAGIASLAIAGMSGDRATVAEQTKVLSPDEWQATKPRQGQQFNDFGADFLSEAR